ncbi:metallophosphoesterase family protein [Micromonosporaceae bacterium DT55]|uniref:metallophosphoesterase family protein n=1 Tax=Melissospora conviva TaxID=3388432 RepID=UPI003C198B92
MSGDRNEQPAAGVGKTPAERRTWRRLGGWLRGPGGWLRGPGGLRLGGWLRGPGGRRIGTALAVLAVTLSGIVIGVALGGRVETDIGPFRAELSISPAGHGRTTIAIPPLGALQLDSHAGPSHLTIRLGALDPGRTEELIDNPAMISRQTETAVDDLRAGVLRLAVRTTAVSVLATLILAALVFRGTRRTAWAGLLALTVTGGTLAYAGLTIRPESLDEPRYEGLLINAPAIVGDVRRIADDYNKYGEQLQQIIGNVTKLYTTVSELPVYEPDPNTTRVLHVSDMHLNPTGWQIIRTVVEQYDIDVVIDTGDINDWGSEPEASYVAAIAQLGVPYVYIRGNHDSATTENAVRSQPNAIVLDDSVTTVGGLAIAGIGDPRFTPDKSTPMGGSELSGDTANQLIANGETLADRIRANSAPVDIALVHDPSAAGPLSGLTPLVLAGHTHNRQVSRLPQAPGSELNTDLMVQGSSGGAGLRGLEGEQATPLSMSVLYFDQERRLQAYDDIRVGGTGEAHVNLERHIVRDPAEGVVDAPVTPTPTRGAPDPTSTPASPAPSGTPARPTPTD